MSRTPGKKYNSVWCPVKIISGSLDLLLLLILSALLAAGAHGKEIDRLLAAVNGTVITESDLVVARGVRVIIWGGERGPTASRAQEIERLIDQELMRQELKNLKMGHEDESQVQARLRSLQDAYAQKGGWSEALRRVGLLEEELISFLRFEAAMDAFVNFRFRPFAAVSEEEIKAYYEGRLAVQLRKSGLPLPPREQVAGKIEEILRQEKINAMLEQWIREIRKNSRIEYFDDFKEQSFASPVQEAGR